MKKRYLVIGIILSLIYMSITPSSAVDNLKKSPTSTFDGKPDLTISAIVDEYYVEGPTLKCVVQNIGSAPSADYWVQTDGYVIFGIIHIYDSYNHGFPFINPGETKYVECGCPSPFIGIIRLRCSVSTSIPEENYNNNRFAHSYFIVNLDPFWVFKELPF